MSPHPSGSASWTEDVSPSTGPRDQSPVTNLEMLKTVMWPSVRVQAARRGYWFQQDGRAGAHHTRSHGFPQVEVRRPTALSEDPAPLACGHPTVRLCPAWPLATSISRSRGANASANNNYRECQLPSASGSAMHIGTYLHNLCSLFTMTFGTFKGQSRSTGVK